MYSTKLIYNLLLLQLVICVTYLIAVDTNNEDEITALPGLKDKLNFKQYSGYLNIPDGKHLFYWFVECETNPADAPVVLWLQGGPGGSSLFALFVENGPFSVDAAGKTLKLNPYSWNREVNMLYIEAPVGTGFSYKDDKNYFNNDTTSAADNRLALVEFFKKYPNLQKNPFYITGESYAGVYIPMLAQEILSTKTDINLKGIGIGNGALTGRDGTDQSVIDLLLGHGLVTIESYERKIEACCQCADGQPVNECVFAKPVNATKCKQAKLDQTDALNAYNIYDDCGGLNDAYLSSMYDQYHSSRFEALGIQTLQQSYSSSNNNKLICPQSGYSDYLNTPAVQLAIHARKPDKNQWYVCCGPYDFTHASTPQHDIVRELIDKYGLKRVTVYNGDFDIVCDFIDDQRFVDNLGYQRDGHYKEWTVDGKSDGIICGYVERYEKGLQFVLVRGSGHMVPKDKPEAALQVLKDLIGVVKL
ncbi:lysosomal protective protein-like [Oppia nitens]|uniref:lysosomal protective protein-like n=1 Tax=Oppia nitens TaxID=1686743 RepID=UPI0023DA3FF7|nr:lysosomal protective protein-like [Oppia nitens]